MTVGVPRPRRATIADPSAREFPLDADLVIPPEYQSYVGQRVAFFDSELSVELATAEDVADALLESVQDETGRLRWIVGVDQVERMHMRHETSEAEYIDWSWRSFGPAR
jgi:hypothetical protein